MAAQSYTNTSDVDEVVFDGNMNALVVHPGETVSWETPELGNILSAEHAAIGKDAVVDAYLHGSAPIRSVLNVQEIFAEDINLYIALYGTKVEIEVDHPIDAYDNWGQVVGVSGGIATRADGSKSLGALVGVVGSAVHRGSGLLNFLCGLNSEVNVRGPAHVEDLLAIDIGRYVDNPDAVVDNSVGLWISSANCTGTAVNAYGIEITDQKGTSTGTISNTCGIYIHAQGDGSESGYNLFSEGAESKNVFEGPVDSGECFKVDGVQVVSARVIDSRADDTVNAGAWDATSAGVLDALRDCMLSHGLLAAA